MALEIVATVGSPPPPVEDIRRMVAAGATTLRFNLASGHVPRRAVSVIQHVREALGSRGAQVPKILVDLPVPGRKPRAITWESKDVRVPLGARLTFTTALANVTAPTTIGVTDVDSLARITPGTQFAMGDGELVLQVMSLVDGHTIIVEAQSDWYISHHKGIGLPREVDTCRATNAEVDALASVVAQCEVEYVALSFVTTDADVTDARSRLSLGKATEVVAKIETEAALDNLISIGRQADVVMLGRGDMAHDAGFTRIGVMQERFLASVGGLGLRAWVATQLLEVSSRSATPNRAEVCDLSRILLSGAEGVVLAKETSAGVEPSRAIELVRAVARATNRQ